MSQEGRLWSALFGEESINAMFESMTSRIPTLLYPVDIIVCDDNTTVFWNDRTNTLVTRMTEAKSGVEAVYSLEDAIAFALVKRLTEGWIDESAIVRDEEDQSVILDNGRRNYMKTALKKVRHAPPRAELREAKKQKKLEYKKEKAQKLLSAGKVADVGKTASS